MMVSDKTAAWYQSHKQRVLARQNASSRIARDIWPLPLPSDFERRESFRYDLRGFMETYFPAMFFRPWAKFHYKFIDDLQSRILHGGRQANGFPRSTGKTTIVRATVPWSLAYGHKKSVCIFAANTIESRKHIDFLQTMFTTSPLFAADFPEICGPLTVSGRASYRNQLYLGGETRILWGKDVIGLPCIPGSEASASRIYSFGVMSANRGQNFLTHEGKVIRPDYIIMDDLMTQEVARSMVMCDHLREVIDGSLSGLGLAGSLLTEIMNGTVMRAGDGFDVYIDPEIYPSWNGVRHKMIESMPTDMDLWESYGELSKRDMKSATRFYRKNRSRMDDGGVVSWDHCYDESIYDSAIQWAMTKYYDNPIAFAAEQQNEPIRLNEIGETASAKEITRRVNYLSRGELPEKVDRLTAFVDVHKDMFYYAVMAFNDDWTSFLVDYGTWPEQRKVMFNYVDAGNDILSRHYPVRGKGNINALLTAALDDFLNDFSTREYTTASGDVTLQPDLVLVDAGWKGDVSAEVLRYSKLVNVKMCRGIGVKSTQEPMHLWPKREGRRYGDHWFRERDARLCCELISSDVNYWKGEVNDALLIEHGEPGMMTLFAAQSGVHRNIARHLTSEEPRFESNKHDLFVWNAIRGRDNHWFDCVVGCYVAASYLGIGSRH